MLPYWVKQSYSSMNPPFCVHPMDSTSSVLEDARIATTFTTPHNISLPWGWNMLGPHREKTGLTCPFGTVIHSKFSEVVWWPVLALCLLSLGSGYNLIYPRTFEFSIVPRYQLVCENVFSVNEHGYKWKLIKLVRKHLIFHSSNN